MVSVTIDRRISIIIVVNTCLATVYFDLRTRQHITLVMSHVIHFCTFALVCVEVADVLASFEGSLHLLCEYTINIRAAS